MNETKVLKSSIAGSWYPGSAGQLKKMLDNAVGAVPRPSTETPPPNIVVLPHAGYVYSLPTAARALKRLSGAKFKRVLLLAPCHCAAFSDRLVAPEADAVSTPLGEIAVDRRAIEAAGRRFPVICSDKLHSAEHSAQILYPLLQYALVPGFEIVPLVVGELSAEARNRASDALKTLTGPDTLVAVSSDFTHYGTDFGFTPFPGHERERTAALDRGAFELLAPGNAQKFSDYIDANAATICGCRPIALMLNMLPENARFELLHYATSSDGDGDYSRFVAYMAIAGEVKWPEPDELLSDNEKIALLGMARRSIAYAFQHRTPCPDTEFSAEADDKMKLPMGCFVTLNSPDGNLRGCIGEIEARRPLYEAVTGRACDAAFRDPRFPELRESELAKLVIEISALTPAKPVASWRDIVIGRHGMTLEKRGRFAVFLPQVAPEQGWDLPTTLSQLALKAGLNQNDWREDARFTVFEATVFSEADFRD